MTFAIIISFCLLLLIAYVFDLTSSKTKIPSVILLLLLGWTFRQLTYWLDIDLPDFTSVLQVLGTIGLILIVLEGALELELNTSKLALIRKSFFGSLIPLLATAFLLAYLFHSFGNYGLKESLTNAIPFCIISSAIGIPIIRNVSTFNKEFVIYESSISDILGVTLFNFLSLNETIDANSFGNFGLQLLVITAVSFISTIALSFLLKKIEHHVKFIPIILLVVLIYSISKTYHLPGMVFILIFGLFIGNLDEIKHFKWIEKFNPKGLEKEVKKFQELTIEGAFLIRSLFFILFGYLVETVEVLNRDSFSWAVTIVFIIFFFRAIQLKFSKLPLQPLWYIAPRGLITILLFVSIEPTHTISIVNKSLIIQVIILTSLIMMIGIMVNKPPKTELQSEHNLDHESIPTKKSNSVT